LSNKQNLIGDFVFGKLECLIESNIESKSQKKKKLGEMISGTRKEVYGCARTRIIVSRGAAHFMP